MPSLCLPPTIIYVTKLAYTNGQARAASEGATASRQVGYLKAAAEGVISKASTVCTSQRRMVRTVL